MHSIKLIAFIYAFILTGHSAVAIGRPMGETKRIAAIASPAEKHTAGVKWSLPRARRWSAQVGWVVGSNYIPASAVNQLEMWQGPTFDLARIETELAWAESLGMSTMRVFLHDQLWISDSAAFLKRVDLFLGVASRHGIRPIFVFFDSCWNPHSQLGLQPVPRPGVHNSGWVQSPALATLIDAAKNSGGRRGELAQYVTGVVTAFARDSRVLAWDVWNEPDNLNGGSYHDPVEKLSAVEDLLPRVFAWARAGHPVQPLTSGVWAGDWSADEKLTAIQAIQLRESDIISFHSYEPAASFEMRVRSLSRYHRPLLLTEYMARPTGSTFAEILPLAHKYHVGAINWGFVRGKTQTYIPWDSWANAYPYDPVLWFHDIFFTNGTPYLSEEIRTIRAWTGARSSQTP